MNQLPEIGGMTPTILWYTVFGIIALGALYIEFDKLRQIKRRRAKEKQEDEATHDDSFREQLTNDIANKVLEKLEPRFSEIDKKLDKDKERLEVHESSINGINQALGVIKEGVEVSCNALAEVLDHELHNGNGTQMEQASAELRKYTTSLIKKV